MNPLQYPSKTPLALLFAGMWILASCGKFQQPEFRDVKNVNMANIQRDASLKLEVVCYNPNKFGATVKNTRCSLFVNTLYLGEFTQDSSIRVTRRSDFVLPVTLKLNKQNLAGLFPVLMADSTVLKVDGTTRVGKSGVFSTYPVKYEGMHHLDILK